MDQDMSGQGGRQVWSPDGTRLYTLYIRQTYGGDDRDREGSAGSDRPSGTDGFVHVLDLAEECAFCLALPPSFGQGELASTALAVSPDGTSVAVADVAARQVAFASTVDLGVNRTVDLPPLPSFDLGSIETPLHLALTADLAALAQGERLAWLDSETLAPLDGSPVELSGPVLALTSSGTAGILVWPRGAGEPYEVRAPPIPAR
jgi:hypothetical protein